MLLWIGENITAMQKLKEYKFDLENANLKGKWIGIFKELQNGDIVVILTNYI